MTVAELIERLRAFDPDLLCVTAGFDEAGVDEIETAKICKIRLNARNEYSHIGRHEQDAAGIEAVWIDF